MILRHEQKLIETWTCTITRRPWGYRGLVNHEARLDVPYSTQIATHGEGRSVEAARIDVLIKTAAWYIDSLTNPDDQEDMVSDETLDFMAKVVRREQTRRRKLRAVA